MKQRLLLTSASAKTTLIFAVKKAALRANIDLEIIAGDKDPESISFNFTDDYWVLPESRIENIEKIIEGCNKRGISIIMPTRDDDVTFYAVNSAAFTIAGIRVMTSSAEVVNRCNDKLLFHDFLVNLGFDVIPTSTKLQDISTELVVVKERFGSGSRNVHLSLTRQEAKSLADSLKKPIFQPMQHGIEISIDVWVSRYGLHSVASPRIRNLVDNGEAKITTTFIDKQTEALALRVAKSLGIGGLCVIQGFMNSNQSLKLIECNPRIGGATTASINSGTPLLELELLEILDLPTQEWISSMKRKEIRQVRASHDYCF